MIGFGTMLSPGAEGCGSPNFTNFVWPGARRPLSNLSADVIFHRRVGIGLRCSMGGLLGTCRRTGASLTARFFSTSMVFTSLSSSKKVGADLFGGIGWQTTRFYQYQNTSNCVYFGACYKSSNRFVDAGAGIRYYVWGHFFVRPEVHYYHDREQHRLLHLWQHIPRQWLNRIHYRPGLNCS